MPTTPNPTNDGPPFLYRVALQCPTPLAHPELEVVADTDDDAWRQFCAANGISDSEHPRAIVRL